MVGPMGHAPQEEQNGRMTRGWPRRQERYGFTVHPVGHHPEITGIPVHHFRQQSPVMPTHQDHPGETP